MKNFKLTVIAILGAIAMIGCSNEKISFVPVQDSVESSNVGILSLDGLVTECRVDERDKDNGVAPEATRSRSVDVNNFDCQIINSDNEVVMEFKVGSRPSGPIELPVGGYVLKVQSGEVLPAAWDAPIYGAEKAFKIERRQTTTINEVICSLLNIKVSLTYAPDLFERLSAETVATVSVGDNALDFVLTETRAAFYLAPNLKNTITIAIAAWYAADKVNYKKVNMTKSVENVSAGQYSKIHLYLSNADKGKLDVNVTLYNWVTDETIPCSVADVITEDEYIENDPNVPSGDNPYIIWDGYDITKRYSLDTVSAVDLLVNAKFGISQFTVQIKSDTLTPEQLASVSLCDVLNLCYPAQSYDSNNPNVYIDVEQPLRELGFAVGEQVLNQQSVTLSITQFLGILKSVSQDGHKHDFVFRITDGQGNATTQTLKLQTGEVTEDEPVDGPVIAWEGYDISQRYSLDDVSAVDLLISATSGIKTFTVQIKSETLTPEQLASVSLCDVLDLCYPTQSYDSNNPGTPIDVEQPLRELGFAVGEQVLNQQSVTLSITQFLGILKSVSKQGHKHDFVLSVTDNNDNTTVQTLMLQTGK